MTKRLEQKCILLRSDQIETLRQLELGGERINLSEICRRAVDAAIALAPVERMILGTPGIRLRITVEEEGYVEVCGGLEG